MRPQDIISDEEVIRVHGNANFGPMSPREVVNDGVRRYAHGYSTGHTMMCILLEHGLIRQPKPGEYASTLTDKGFRYARSIYQRQDAVQELINAFRAEVDARALYLTTAPDRGGMCGAKRQRKQALEAAQFRTVVALRNIEGGAS